MVVIFFSQPQWYLLFFFLIIAILTGVRGNLNVDLILISLMTKDVEHFQVFIDHFNSQEIQ
jgi:hypothetical protein